MACAAAAHQAWYCGASPPASLLIFMHSLPLSVVEGLSLHGCIRDSRSGFKFLIAEGHVWWLPEMFPTVV